MQNRTHRIKTRCIRLFFCKAGKLRQERIIAQEDQVMEYAAKRQTEHLLCDPPGDLELRRRRREKGDTPGPWASTLTTPVSDDTYFGQKTWEKAENRMQQLALDDGPGKGRGWRRRTWASSSGRGPAQPVHRLVLQSAGHGPARPCWALRGLLDHGRGAAAGRSRRRWALRPPGGGAAPPPTLPRRSGSTATPWATGPSGRRQPSGPSLGPGA